MKTEPVLTALLVDVVAAVLALLVSFGVDLSADQRASIIAVWTLVVAVASTLWARSKVSPT